MRSLAVLLIAGGMAVLAMLFLASLAEAQSNPNAFNRLMKPASERNAPPPEDGIHDPDNSGTHILQTPRESFDARDRCGRDRAAQQHRGFTGAAYRAGPEYRARGQGIDAGRGLPAQATHAVARLQ
jgi:hypothetical protein